MRGGTCSSVLPKCEIDLLIGAILIHVCLAHGSCQGSSLSARIHISTGVLYLYLRGLRNQSWGLLGGVNLCLFVAVFGLGFCALLHFQAYM